MELNNKERTKLVCTSHEDGIKQNPKESSHAEKRYKRKDRQEKRENERREQ